VGAESSPSKSTPLTSCVVFAAGADHSQDASAHSPAASLSMSSDDDAFSAGPEMLLRRAPESSTYGPWRAGQVRAKSRRRTRCAAAPNLRVDWNELALPRLLALFRCRFCSALAGRLRWFRLAPFVLNAPTECIHEVDDVRRTGRRLFFGCRHPPCLDRMSSIIAFS
jgi:hypothetical protein